MQHLVSTVRLGALMAVILLALSACGGSSNTPQGDPTDPDTTTATGNAQKGPFRPGGDASAQALAADGSLKGAPVTGSIDEDGAFSLPEIDWTGPTRLTMSGTFYDEFAGNFSMGANAQATLHGLANLPDESQANVNLFTHFITARVVKLMGDGAAFADARDQARDDLAAIMGINQPPSKLDLLHGDSGAAQDSDSAALDGDSVDQDDVGATTGDDNANGDDVGTVEGNSEDDSANLLLFSAAVLAADVNQTDIDAIAADFADDGQINGGGQGAFDAIKQATVDNPDLLTTARTNLQGQYGVAPPEPSDDTPPAWTPDAPAAPVATFTTSGPLEEGATQSFDARESTGNGLIYDWDLGDGESAAGPQPTHVYAEAGTYTVTLTVFDDNDRSDDTSRELNITAVTVTPDPPTASFGYTGNPVPDQELSFDASDSMGASLSYAWTFGDGSMASGAEVAHAYAEPGDYTVELTVTDSAGQTDVTTQTVTVAASVYTLVDKVAADDGKAEDEFGSAVAIEGNTAVVGTGPRFVATGRGDQYRGAAYIYTRLGSTWQQRTKLISCRFCANDYFGRTIAIDGGTVVVGAERSGGVGAVYVFVGSDDSWTQVARLNASDATSNGLFGSRVAMSGNTLVVNSRNATYVFTGSGSDWEQKARIEGASSGLAIDGNTIVVGRSGEDVEGNRRQGATDIYTRTGDVWSRQARLTADDGSEFDGFGRSVAIDGSNVLVSAGNVQVGDNVNQGAAYIFTRSGGDWSQQAKLTASDGAESDTLGIAVALKGDLALVGTQGATIGGNVSQGAAYAFKRAGDGNWSQQSKLTAGDAVHFGFSVAISGDTTLVGARSAPIDGNRKQGAAYFYRPDGP